MKEKDRDVSQGSVPRHLSQATGEGSLAKFGGGRWSIEEQQSSAI